MRPSPVRGTPATPGRPLRLAVEASAASPAAVHFVREAERLGVHATWVPEMWGYDAPARLTVLAQTIELTAEVNRERMGGSP